MSQPPDPLVSGEGIASFAIHLSAQFDYPLDEFVDGIVAEIGGSRPTGGDT